MPGEDRAAAALARFHAAMEENKQRFYRASRESRDSYEKVAVTPGLEEIELNDDGTGEVEPVPVSSLVSARSAIVCIAANGVLLQL